MKKERRWMTSVAKEAARCKVEMPWARGTRRAAFIARRQAAQAQDQNRAQRS